VDVKTPDSANEYESMTPTVQARARAASQGRAKRCQVSVDVPEDILRR